MPAGSFTLYDSVAKFLGDGTLDLDGHTFKIVLLTSAYVPNATHSTLGNISPNEIAGANGYTTGGGTLTGVTWTRTGSVAKFTSNNFVWTATGGSIVARYAAIYDDTDVNKSLIGYYLLDATPADVTATAGNTFTVGPHATNGWFQHTVNPV